ncbi:MAG: preprotein translocase subunit SecG [Gammaproteobacteria bacterium]|jgi:preprotein translocase subunit SecG|nr:preprotein translocase subunit SecG [Gammaproteobacteria bacterium]MDH3935277.1 preprotein translocase subunit SecG [Gammaproteobacteria bacterium]MDH3987413.1 preprotein translocase subunit SecG [Gammaproteobacteria bacterium]
MFSLLLVVQIVVSVSIIALVMLQQGKGADMGAGFGAGASGTVFGSRGSGSFFTRATAILAAVFFINCLLIASPLIRDNEKSANTLADQLEQQAVQMQEAEEANEIVDALENQQADSLPEAGVEAVVVEDDVPDLPALEPEPAVSPGKSDLPE